MKILQSKVSIFICLLVSLILFGCAKEPVQHKLLKSMAELDRVYIPALLFTNLQRQRESEIALERLRYEWNKFHRTYYNLEFKYGVDIVDKFWKEDFGRVDGLMVSAEGFLKEGKLTEAHEELEGIRFVFKELRHRNGLGYFLDGMTDFHATMEQILSVISGKDELKERDLEELQRLSREALEEWDKVAGADIDPEVFAFENEKIDAVKKRIKYEEEALANFEAALSSGEEDQIFQAAQDIKPNFVVLYKAFGDFQSVFDRIIQERKENPI